MRLLGLKPDGAKPLHILCLGCHSDDIEIGCGGTLLRLAAELPDCVFHWVVFSATGPRAEEAEQTARQFIPSPRLRGPLLKAFPDGFMPFVGAEIKAEFEALKKSVSPDLIFTHHRKDAHQDHRIISELTWNTFRDHLILEYEIPKYDGDLGQPNVFVPLEPGAYRQKVALLMDGFPSQRNKPWFTQDVFLGLMRLRGMECNAASGHAEAFFGRKLVF